MPPIPMTQPQARADRAVPAWTPVRPEAPPENAFGFCLFLLVNLALFVRPADIHPSMVGVEFYLYIILLCFAVSFPAVLARLTPASLEKHPIDLCVLMLLPAILLSHLTAARLGDAAWNGYDFFKVIVYYLLFVGLVTTSFRLRMLTGALVLYATVMTLLSILDFYHFIRLPRVKIFGREQALEEGRMYGPGIFSDPNDVCVIIVVAILLLFAQLSDRRQGVARVLWLPCLGIFGFGFYLTQSRGGMLALVAGAAMFIRLRFGWRQVLLFGLLGLPLLAMLGARQTTISLGRGSGQERMYLWAEGLRMFREQPVFGVGWTEFATHAKQCAHNAYINVLAELGLFGGVFFVGAWYLALAGMYRLAQSQPPAHGGAVAVQRHILDPDLARLFPYITGALVAYAVGMLTLSLDHMAPTYTFLAVASAFLARAQTYPATPALRFELGFLLRMAGVCILFLAATYVFLRVGL